MGWFKIFSRFQKHGRKTIYRIGIYAFVCFKKGESVVGSVDESVTIDEEK
jgi:hypothetical protein